MKAILEKYSALIFGAILLAMFVALIVRQADEPIRLKQRSIEKPKDWRPDIRHCYRTEVDDLWDCIRNPGDYKHLREQMYRTDV